MSQLQLDEDSPKVEETEQSPHEQTEEQTNNKSSQQQASPTFSPEEHERNTPLSQQLAPVDGDHEYTTSSATSASSSTGTVHVQEELAATSSDAQIVSSQNLQTGLDVQNSNDHESEKEQFSPTSATPVSELSSAPGSAEKQSSRKRRRAQNIAESKTELGIDQLADDLREKITSGGFSPNHPLASLQGSRLLFVDNAKCPMYNQKMDSQNVCCLTNRVDRFDENNLPSFAHFLSGYRRHPAIFEDAVSYMVDADQTYAWQWLLGYTRLMAIPSNALDNNFSPLCLERGIMNMSGFVTEKVRRNICILIMNLK